MLRQRAKGNYPREFGLLLGTGGLRSKLDRGDRVQDSAHVGGTLRPERLSNCRCGCTHPFIPARKRRRKDVAVIPLAGFPSGSPDRRFLAFGWTPRTISSAMCSHRRRGRS
jgi:hypothetical protein